MSQIFHRSTNTLARVSLLGGLVLLAGAGWIFAQLDRSPYTTRQGVVREQPVPFSHEHHVSGLGIDCRFCHGSVERAAFAGMPSTGTCMQCHSQLWTDAPLLEPVRESWSTGKPLAWTRVHDLPDFVFFDHSIHVAKGVSCARCHGDVAEMPLVSKAASLRMDWCLDCHRDPHAALAGEPVGDPFGGVAGASFARGGDDLLGPATPAARRTPPQPRMSCSACHR